MKTSTANLEPALRRILIFMPFGKDAKLAREVLEGAGAHCHVCSTVAELLLELERGAGVLLSMEEALPATPHGPIEQFLAKQPPWSDLPVLVLTQPGGDSPWIRGAYERLGNLTLLERPVRATALVSAVRSALRARQRQHEIHMAEQRKDEFLAMLAHELRNPMAPISAAAYVLECNAGDPQKVRASSEIINRQIGHMTNLIDDLLDVARVTRGIIQLDTTALDMRDILSEAVEQVMPMIRLREHDLQLNLPGGPIHVLGDRERLIQVLVNLLNNACKYTPNGGRLEASATLSYGVVELAISDNGIGMTAPTVERVFEIFTQAERTSDRSQGGLGLGLALVKNLVVAHGGTVRAVSPGLGKGSRFVVQLPLLQGHQPKQTEPQQGAFRLASSLRILLVDDNVDAANALAMLLTELGHVVSTEHKAVAALERARREAPQVCLLDVGMPDIDGYELARRLRSQSETAQALLIAVTGYGQARDREMAFAAGFHHHFVKPVDTARLFEVLANFQQRKTYGIPAVGDAA